MECHSSQFTGSRATITPSVSAAAVGLGCDAAAALTVDRVAARVALQRPAGAGLRAGGQFTTQVQRADRADCQRKHTEREAVIHWTPCCYPRPPLSYVHRPTQREDLRTSCRVAHPVASRIEEIAALYHSAIGVSDAAQRSKTLPSGRVFLTSGHVSGLLSPQRTSTVPLVGCAIHTPTTLVPPAGWVPSARSCGPPVALAGESTWP